MEKLFQFSLLGLVTSGYLAVVASGLLDTPTAVLTGLALFARALMVSGFVDIQLPEKSALWATLAYILFYPVDYFLLTREFIGATIHLVFFLSVLRILTARTYRDYLYVQLLALLEILGACVLSAQLNFLVFLGLFILFGLFTLAAGEVRRASQDPAVLVPSPGLSLRLVSFLTLGIHAADITTSLSSSRTANASSSASRRCFSQRLHPRASKLTHLIPEKRVVLRHIFLKNEVERA